MQNPFCTLGVDRNAGPDEVRAAYHQRVKQCHPDQMRDAASQQIAQEKLVALNLAYAEAMRVASQKKRTSVGIRDAKQAAKRLLDQGKIDSALRMLARAPQRDAEWFDLQGSILLKMGQAEAAHASFRTAVRLEPENNRHRELALSAGVQMRKQKTLRGRMSGWARGIVGKML